VSVLNRFRLDGKRALVTGGSRGLGFEMAKALAEAGADLVLVGREQESLTKAAGELASLGRRIEAMAFDVGSTAGMEAMCAEALARHVPIDILINNVGGRRLSVPSEDLGLADWQRILDLNLTSTFLCCQKIGKAMIERQRGVIINVGSISGLVVSRGIHGRTYETSKAALHHFTRTLAVDWARYNIRVNAIAPGAFLTAPNRKWFSERPELRRVYEEHTPLGRVGEPQEIGPLVVYLASDASSYVTGSVVVIDGGYTLW
jgi:gluconate 5-dehydrogenase